MPIQLTHKQMLLLRTAAMTLIIYLLFKCLMPLLLPFLAAALLSILIRPAVWFLYKRFHIPMGVAATMVLVVLLAVLGASLFFLGRMVVEQLIRLGEQLPSLWDDCSVWLQDRCTQVEQYLHWEEGIIVEQVNRMTGWKGGMDGRGNVPMSGIVTNQMAGKMVGWLGTVFDTSLQGVVSVVKAAASFLVTIFITIGATIITTTQLEELKHAADRSRFRREIRRIIDILTRVGTAYGKTQLVIMLCTVIISAAGLTLMGDPYALLWAAAVGLVDALPLFGAGTILWPWVVLSILRGQWMQVIGLSLIYVISNLIRQWLEARYMGERIGLSALENLIAMYLGLRLFGLLGLFWGPIGYLLIKESQRNWVEG